MSSLNSIHRRPAVGRWPPVATVVCSLLVLAASPLLGHAAVPAGPAPHAAAEADRHVFVEVSTADPGRSVYVQQQTPYTVRLYFDDTIRKGQLAAPNPADAVVEQLGEDQRGTAVRGGRRFNVVERHYAIAPEKSGVLRIPPVTFNGSQIVPEIAQNQAGPQGADAPVDDLMARMLRNTPFANDPLMQRALAQGMGSDPAMQPVSAQSSPVVIDVKSRPAAARGDWLPAEAVTVHDSWRDNPPQLKAGEPVTRTLTIDARGLSASQIPQLSPAPPDNAHLYPEAADNQSHTDGRSIVGISRQRLTYIPDAQGKLAVPAIELPWWDVVADAPRTATVPSLSLTVAPNPGVDATAGTATTSAPARVSADHAVAPRPISIAIGRRSLGDHLGDHRAAIAVVALLAALLATAGIAIGRSRRRPGAAIGTVDGLPSPRKAACLRELKQACAANDAVAAASALLRLGRAQWPNDPPRGLSALASRLQNDATEIIALNRSLYGAGDPLAWRGAALWQALRGGPKPRRSGNSFGDDGPRALYPRS